MKQNIHVILTNSMVSPTSEPSDPSHAIDGSYLGSRNTYRTAWKCKLLEQPPAAICFGFQPTRIFHA